MHNHFVHHYAAQIYPKSYFSDAFPRTVYVINKNKRKGHYTAVDVISSTQ